MFPNFHKNTKKLTKSIDSASTTIPIPKISLNFTIPTNSVRHNLSANPKLSNLPIKQHKTPKITTPNLQSPP